MTERNEFTEYLIRSIMEKTYTQRGMKVPAHIIESIDRYVNRGIPTGDFLRAVINNDLSEACARADEHNMPIIPAIVAYLYNECPRQCWGNAKAFDAWIKLKQDEREAEVSRRRRRN